jgi:hypothetical protein
MNEPRKPARRRRAPNPHVVVRFDFGRGTRIKYEPFAENKLGQLDDKLAAELRKVSPHLWLRPLYRGMPVGAWTKMIRAAEEKNPAYRKNRPDFFEYFEIAGPRNVDFCRIAAILNRYPEVRYAYVERLALAPQDQQFRWPAPSEANSWIGGIDVPAARAAQPPSGSGGQRNTGSAVRFADVEEGWYLQHGQLPVAPQLSLPPGEYNNPNEAGHGAAVLGIVCAKEDATGPEGIVPDAQGVAISSVDQYGNPALQAAIQRAATHLRAGDVLVIEAQIYESSTSGCRVPVEAVSDASFWAIATLVGNDIVVVEAGGNGDEWTGEPIDFDAYADPVSGDPVLTRAFRDSGAILVSAADMPAPPTFPDIARTYSAPYGDRIDCFAWGNGVYTCWDGNLVYIADFSGTSAATAIVAGAAILLQDVAKNTRGTTLTPERIRDLFHHAANTPCGSESIGRMPNLGGLIPLLP